MHSFDKQIYTFYNSKPLECIFVSDRSDQIVKSTIVNLIDDDRHPIIDMVLRFPCRFQVDVMQCEKYVQCYKSNFQIL